MTEISREVLTVGQLNQALYELIDMTFDTVWVRGEISNLKIYPSGHWYFKLKDADSQINAVMFKGRNSSLTFKPIDGDQVEVAAQVGFYAARGDVQLTVQVMKKAGAGALFEAFLKLKKKLELLGLFESGRKKVIPAHPRAIGIVTSSQAAALKDVLATLARRAPHIPIMIFPSPVQGPEAPPGLIKAIKQAEESAPDEKIDVILLVRGGGSIEDLWAFNDEQLAHAIANCSIPIISGVGHETDFTIADFVADLRAPTPTGAAEISTPDSLELKRDLETMAGHLKRATRLKLEREAQRLDQLSLRLSHAIPNPQKMREKLVFLQERLTRAISSSIESRRRQHQFWQNQLNAYSPGRILERGYSLILKEDVAVRAPRELEANHLYTVMMAGGIAEIKLNDVKLISQDSSSEN
ncbi:MAG: exodeoxyribonuclease VII large subunit [Betaproteobacteria bacterium]